MTNPINKIEPYQIDTAAAITFSNTVTLGSVANVKITGGSSGQVLSTDGTGNVSFTTTTGESFHPFLLGGM